ncbi:MAG: TetR/AcrR family transcriptional regulator [Acidobacteria bacterium]|nr:TetR/AcrR family transcriptional regulator [Acidobacteriota bacterium]
MPVLGRSKKEALTEFRMAELLEAARKVFAEKGFHEATVDEIADAAGVAKGTVYLYYQSKQAIYWAALERGITALLDEVKTRVGEEETLEDKVRAFIAIKIAYFEKNRDFFAIYISEFGSAFTHPAQLRKRFGDLYLQQSRVIEAVLQEGIKRKVIRSIRPDIAALAISDLTRGIITQRLLGWSKGDVESDIRFVFDLVWRGIAA